MLTAHGDEHSLCLLLTSAEGVGKMHLCQALLQGIGALGFNQLRDSASEVAFFISEHTGKNLIHSSTEEDHTILKHVPELK